MSKKIWYKEEASLWEEALPIGNGRIGAMVFSGAIYDKFQINEETLWSGYPNIHTGQHSITEVEKIRKLVEEKEFSAATKATGDLMFGYASQCYMSYGNIFVDILCEKKDIKDYRRELDLETSIVKTEYLLNDVKVSKKTFISLKDDILVLHITSDKALKYHIYQAVELENKMCADNGVATAFGRCPTYISKYTGEVKYDENESIHFCSRIKVITDAQQFSGGNSIWTAPTTELTLLFSIKTSFNGYNKMPVSEGKEYIRASMKDLEYAEKYSYTDLEKRHIDEYKKYFDRVNLRIDGKDYEHLPTNERIKNVANGIVDNNLVTLLFDFSRYLSISSSMPGTQPANLQGIWSYHLISPWHSNYTMNINAQMNYWATETCNLPECHMPFLIMLKELSEKGNNFGLHGWAVWHNSDIWRFNHEAAKSPMCGFWPMGGFWAVRHIWEHYIHTNDIEFLREYYPVMVGAAKFLEDWMYEDEYGFLTTCPSTSPENAFIHNGESCCVGRGSAMDMSIIYDLFDKLIKCSEILGENTEYYKEIKNKLTPVKIGNDGRILEWGEELLEEDLGHRHVSHLYGFYPADIFTDEKYINAARETLRVRMENGGGHTGWSNAWIATLYARFSEGEKVMEHIRNMFAKSIYPNMLDAHPPFQIDGNFGIAAAICEALMQSHNGEIKLIPALPKEWKSGEVRGFVTRTGDVINFKWCNGKAEIIKE